MVFLYRFWGFHCGGGGFWVERILSFGGFFFEIVFFVVKNFFFGLEFLILFVFFCFWAVIG